MLSPLWACSLCPLRDAQQPSHEDRPETMLLTSPLSLEEGVLLTLKLPVSYPPPESRSPGLFGPFWSQADQAGAKILRAVLSS